VIDVTILVGEDHLGAIDDVAAALRAAGLRHDVALPATGVVTGAVPDEATLAALEGVAGVEAVERAQEIQLPPPDAPEQ
jgi:hypothetical protein